MPDRAPLRLVFAGTPPFAERALDRLAAAGHDIALVLTQPDRPSGRGLRTIASAVKRSALQRGLKVFQPADFRAPDSVDRVRAARADALVVAAYGLLLPPALLTAARHGALNIHASLLPRWRGAAPIQRAILAGDTETGVSIMQMDAGLDTGPVFARRAIPIEPHDDASSLQDKLATLGAQMIVQVLEEVAAGRAQAEPQPQSGVTYARKISKAEAVLDWSHPAIELERAVRAFHPATTSLAGEPLRIWRARVAPSRGEPPGKLLQADEPLVIACGEAALSIQELQRPGGKRLETVDFLRGRTLHPDTRFG